MDPADDLYFMVNCFEDLRFGRLEEIQDAQDGTTFLKKSQLEVYLADAVSRMVSTVTRNGNEATNVGAAGDNDRESSMAGKNTLSFKPQERPKSSYNGKKGKQGRTSAGRIRPSTAKAQGRAKSAPKPSQSSKYQSDGSTSEGENTNDDSAELDSTPLVGNGMPPSVEALGKLKNPLQYLHMYFELAALGKHVVGADFAFILATNWNRLCFVRLICESVRHMDPHRLVSKEDFVQIIRLFCLDFPRDFIRLCWAISSDMAEERGGLIISDLDDTFDTVTEPKEAGRPQPMRKIELRTITDTFVVWFMYNEFLGNLITTILPDPHPGSTDSGTSSLLERPMTISTVLSILQHIMRARSSTFFRPPVAVIGRVHDSISSFHSQRTVISGKELCQGFCSEAKAIFITLKIHSWGGY